MGKGRYNDVHKVFQVWDAALDAVIAGTYATVTYVDTQDDSHQAAAEATAAAALAGHVAAADPHPGAYAPIAHNHDLVYAPIAKGVTNGDTHDHSGGDGAQINHTTLSNIGTNTHAQIDTHLANTSNPHSVTAQQLGGVIQDLDTLGAPGVADLFPYSTGAGAFAYGTMTAAGRALMDDASGAAQITTLGIRHIKPAADVTFSNTTRTTVWSITLAAGEFLNLDGFVRYNIPGANNGQFSFIATSTAGGYVLITPFVSGAVAHHEHTFTTTESVIGFATTGTSQFAGMKGFLYGGASGGVVTFRANYNSGSGGTGTVYAQGTSAVATPVS